ncbi:T9SS type A sorting domain-containing protein [Dyadobacter sp. CY312]|uniref:T9SS type A sorting domain-containing protein n=1 Tax=Dyadobacter sp. CY312 TaxID=2907303 RepID=UPI001F2F3E8E|nr:T9SS type A sorting domain-containing protein [Dyadobacter sp. CY312]MCE7042843.1 T9SS type A sorting domain-containing protein [Dyadobacter sp. CY312]
MIGISLDETDALPVILEKFSALKEANQTVLTWTTTEEANASHFDIQRSGNGQTWNQIGSKLAVGNNRGSITYLTTDVSPLLGLNYYRLKMVDQDGSFSFSHIQHVEFENIGVTLYPNPAVDALYVKGLNTVIPIGISIINANGQVVLNSRYLSESGINVKKLPGGVYTVRVEQIGAILKTTRLIIE